jgi:hypothetical protein
LKVLILFFYIHNAFVADLQCYALLFNFHFLPPLYSFVIEIFISFHLFPFLLYSLQKIWRWIKLLEKLLHEKVDEWDNNKYEGIRDKLCTTPNHSGWPLHFLLLRYTKVFLIFLIYILLIRTILMYVNSNIHPF